MLTVLMEGGVINSFNGGGGDSMKSTTSDTSN